MQYLKGIGVTNGVCEGVLLSLDSDLNVHDSIILFIDDFTPQSIELLLKHENINALIASEGSLSCHAANLLEEHNRICNHKVEAIVSTGHKNLELIIGNRLYVNAYEGVIKGNFFSEEIYALYKEQLSKASMREKTNSITKIIDGKKWTCYRPNYAYNDLDYDILSTGFSMSPNVLFNRNKCSVLRDEDKRFWLHNEVTPYDVVLSIENDLEWFFDISRKQIQVFDQIYQETQNILVKYAKEKKICFCYLTELKNNLIKFYSYLPLTLSSYELLFKRYVDYLIKKGISEAMALQSLRNLRTSSFALIAYSKGVFHSLEKWVSFPASVPIIINTNINILTLEDSVKKVDNILDENILNDAVVKKYLQSIPLMFELKEQKFYIAKSLLTSLNYFLDIMADLLYKKGVICNKKDILNIKINDLVKYLN